MKTRQNGKGYNGQRQENPSFLGKNLLNMETHQAAGGGGDEQQICRRNSVKYGKCKNVSGDNELQYCDFHHIILADILTNGITSKKIEPLTKKKKKNKEEEKKNPPPYEQRCSHGSNGKWRCKNLRMGHGAAAADDDSVPKTRYCEKHYNYYSSYRKNHKKKKRSGDGEGAGSSAAIGIETLQFLSENPCFKDMKLPPDEQRCSKNNGRWRCNNLRMSGVPKTRYCQKHCNYRANYLLKKISGDCEGAGSSAVTGLTEIRDSNCSKRRKKVMDEDDCSLDVTGGIRQPTTGTIVASGVANTGRKTEIVERTEGSGDLESLAGIREPVVVNLVSDDDKCFELSVELEKKKLECTKLPGILLGEVETRKTAAKVEPEEWNKCSDLESRVLKVENENSTKRCVISNLESLVQRNRRFIGLRNFEKIESEAWGLQDEVTPAGEKQNTRKPNAETSSGRRKDTHVFELKTEENVQGIGINKHKESESECHDYSAVEIHSGSLHLSSGGEKVEEGEGWGCLEERPSQHGSSSEDHLEMSTKAFVNLVSDDDSGECLDESEDSDSSTDSEGSLGTLMDKMAMKYRNRNEDKEMKWKFEADMLSSFEEEPELCVKAVCALYRQQIFEDEKSDKGLFNNSDALRATTLAKFLMDGACGGDLKKSLKELKKFDSKGVEDCKKLARSYSKQLFSIYQNRKDPNFLLATTASHEDQTAKIKL